MLDATNLIWIKNVKRDQGNAWAYMEHNVGDLIDLHFPNNDLWYPTNYEKPELRDCILIFQTVNAPIAPITGTYLTHIVTPVTNYVEVSENEVRKYRRKVAVVAKSDHGILLPDGWSFFKANRGQICPLDIVELNGINPGLIATQQTFWGLFQNINVNVDDDIFQSDLIETIEPEIIEVVEGTERILLKLHKIIERNARIIRTKKTLAIQNNQLYCEACNFDFSIFYPGIGEGFIECHHRLPIAQGGIVTTTLQDLAFVCSNCHRMLHRKNQEGNYYTVEELRGLIQQNRQ